MLKPLRRDTLTYKVAEAIWRFILREMLPSGARLPSERKLSETLAVSRNIIREALGILEGRDISSSRLAKAHLSKTSTTTWLLLTCFSDLTGTMRRKPK